MGNTPTSNVWPSDLPFIVNADGNRLRKRCWPAEGSPRAILFISHGFGEYTDYYENFVEKACARSILVVGHDHLGHGRSEGDRVDCENFRVYSRDVLEHVKCVKEEHQGIPLFILGHSMGGTVALLATLDEPDAFDGLILSAPFILSFHELSFLKKTFLSGMATVLPQFQLPSPIDGDATRNQKMAKQYRDDPLTWKGSMKARWAYSILKAGSEIQQRLTEIRTPFLVLHGTADRMTNIEGSRLLHEQAQSEDKNIKIYEDYYHKLISEPEEYSSVVIKDILDWLEARL